MPQIERLIPVSESVSLHTIISTPTSPTSRSTIILLHFWGGSNRTWAPLIALLENEVSIIAPSLRGWGKSSRPSQIAAYHSADYAADIAGLFRKLEARQPNLFSRGIVLVSHSMGAKIAQLLLTKLNTRELIKAVVLVAPAPAGSFALLDDMREQQIHAYDNIEVAKFVIQNVLLGKPDNVNEAALVSLATDAVSGGPEARAAWPAYGMADELERTVLTEVELFSHAGQPLKILVVVGELDRVETRENVEARVSNVLSSADAMVETMILGNVGHLSPVEAPEQVAQAVLKLASTT